eukprot:CAMPEP_0172361158 /NCGR_PEP_ID=MMETSP1060-20121228/5034_1 /TAXON_ID=37318 /ORGANISM="Pseudo-nitzschia pungens, Strain cf. cingulata" /LENGTH=897 /DNA_ID=CAMNT_0013083337 /DNA_START=156 /DNA_END=2849 /DNA_ORIENTATION=-
MGRDGVGKRTRKTTKSNKNNNGNSSKNGSKNNNNSSNNKNNSSNNKKNSDRNSKRNSNRNTSDNGIRINEIDISGSGISCIKIKKKESKKKKPKQSPRDSSSSYSSSYSNSVGIHSYRTAETVQVSNISGSNSNSSSKNRKSRSFTASSAPSSSSSSSSSTTLTPTFFRAGLSLTPPRISLRLRSRSSISSQPVDLDELIDTMRQTNRNNNSNANNSSSNANNSNNNSSSSSNANNNNNNNNNNSETDGASASISLRQHQQSAALSPADTFDTVPLTPSSFSSSSSTSSGNGNGNDSSRDYLPVSLLNFDDAASGSSSGSAHPKKSNEKNKNNRATTSKVVIEHQMKMASSPSQKRDRSRSHSVAVPLCVWWIKPLLGLGLLALVLAGAATIFGWLFKFPSLNQQVDALKVEIEHLNGQISRLEGEVDRLESENDRYSYLNQQLNGTVWDLHETQQDLNATNQDLEDTALTLETTTGELSQKVQELSARNNEYAKLNAGLEATVQQLVAEAASIKTALEGLEKEHALLSNTTASLRELAIQFSDATNDTNDTLQLLTRTLEGFVAENDRLESLNGDLFAGLTYLNVTLALGQGQQQAQHASLTQLVATLGDQVRTQQLLTKIQLEISYRQLLSGWDCDLESAFGGSPTIVDTITETSSTNHQNQQDSLLVISKELADYIDDRVLSKMCLDEMDFLDYLYATQPLVVVEKEEDAEEVIDGNTNTNSGSVAYLYSIEYDQFVRGLVLYTERAMAYYFPPDQGGAGVDASASATVVANGNGNVNGDRNGLRLDDWIDAGFRCQTLESPFVWKDVSERTTYTRTTSGGTTGEQQAVGILGERFRTETSEASASDSNSNNSESDSDSDSNNNLYYVRRRKRRRAHNNNNNNNNNSSSSLYGI